MRTIVNRRMNWWLLIAFCAVDGMRASQALMADSANNNNNRTYNHIIRFNTWQNPNGPPVPIGDYLLGKSPTVFPSVRDVDESAAATRSSPAAAGCATTSKLQFRRQVDPLHSCIEAKCSTWNSGGYLDCIYRHCISGFQLHGRRDVSKRDGAAAVNDSFGPPEGRFLLLPVSVDQPSQPQQLLPDLLRSDAVRRELMAAVSNAAMRAGQPDAVDEAREEMTSQTDRDRDTTLSELRDRQTRLLKRRSILAKWSDLQQTKRSVNKYETANKAASKLLAAAGARGRLQATTAAQQQQQPMMDRGASSSSTLRRSYNDIADVCVEHHCGLMQPHTISFFQCVEHHCTGKRSSA